MNLTQYLTSPIDTKFRYFMDTRFSTNRTPSYWINWDNVLQNMASVEISLNTLNYLVGKDNIKELAKTLFTKQPELLQAIPILLASREEDIDVLAFNQNGEMYSYDVDFSKPDLSKLDNYIKFMDESGLFNFLQNNLKMSLVDYVYGVQAGLDTNGRKNRSGTQNEIILEHNLKDVIFNDSNLKYKTQATGKWIEENWGITVPEVLQKGKKGGRRYDGAVLNKNQKSVTIIETNFYGDGGSKLKAVAGEFSSLYETSLRDAHDVKFVWISDGPGWLKAKNPMREAFDVIPVIINLQMVKNGFLKEIVNMSSDKIHSLSAYYQF